MKEEELIRLCCSRIESKLNWGPTDRWTNKDFEKLSELIAGHTQTRLSISTLKRVWGKVNHDSLPSVATLNTLAQYHGYESWHHFRQEHTSWTEETKEPIIAAPVPPSQSLPWWQQRPVLRKTLFMLCLILLGLLV